MRGATHYSASNPLWLTPLISQNTAASFPKQRSEGFELRSCGDRVFDSLDDLLERAEQRCLQLLDVPELLSGLTCFHWWRTFGV